LGTRCFATTRQGYRQMLAWMRSFGEVQRIGIELLRDNQNPMLALHRLNCSLILDHCLI
jgi:hypothetical protein